MWLNPTPCGNSFRDSYLVSKALFKPIFSLRRHYMHSINRINNSPLFLVFLSLMLSQKIFHKSIGQFCCQLTFIWVLFAEDCCGRCFSAALQQLSLRLGELRMRLGELRMFNWLNDILFCWICKNFWKHLGGDLCIFPMLYISDLFWRTYAHEEKQEMKNNESRQVRLWIHKSSYNITFIGVMHVAS